MKAMTAAGRRAQGSKVKLSEALGYGVSLPPSEAVSSHAGLANPPPAARGTTGGIGTREPTVLLIDDDHAWRGEFSRYVRVNGFDSVELNDFPALVARMRSSDGACVVVADLTVATRHLFDSIAEISSDPGAAVLVLSDHRDETETIVALELGADDVIDKSTDRREILARIRAAARRLMARQGAPRPDRIDSAAVTRNAAASWRFLLDKRELSDPEGRRILLTTGEFKLLEAFVANTGRPLHRSDLSTLVLGRRYRPSDRGIDNLVAKLRRKLGESAKLPRMIKTARPCGYVFTGFNIGAEDRPDAVLHHPAAPRVHRRTDDRPQEIVLYRPQKAE